VADGQKIYKALADIPFLRKGSYFHIMTKNKTTKIKIPYYTTHAYSMTYVQCSLSV